MLILIDELDTVLSELCETMVGWLAYGITPKNPGLFKMEFLWAKEETIK